MAFVWARYLLTKVRASFADSVKRLERGEIKEKDLFNATLRKVMRERLTYKYLVQGEEMAPTFASQGENVLVRSITSPSARSVYVSDVVMLRHPTDPSRKLVRRVAAVEGDEMLSTDDKDEPFQLERGQCWVLCDNPSVGAKEAQDSRTFGPLPVSNIEGRVIYFSRSSVDHGPVLNSDEAMEEDSAVLAMELDVDELTRQP
ncbi:hypothetical protein MPTK1_8g14280 [Marchantia polymorpha subsp. ruderalis]|uniref:Peptidase S26 domain-containing protein n=2 Tax=Marchantia polymorpha TaxID=3197 RepID=A0A176W907_MARPO|nr:hypothetical protein AXG93_2255s1140 [Marchantia polymorpha subsp. ruderalis]PTQ31710.1 hypothetical protein MARPO_0108s0055 [Marchantia polymorpha]BBN19858.1 hypothetical protein Mp_8g14280 [Marchantia polymorpha subsp. ruderalis]|eukprot:PTQ31710.1 hypothetical protein MARPO_0108s0055 [Marchantia polymorpha]